jgi:hypothetical protein
VAAHNFSRDLKLKLEKSESTIGVQCIIVKHLYNDTKIKRNHKNMLERIRIFQQTITEAQNQDCFMDGQELTNIESEIDDKKSDDEPQLQAIEVKQVEIIPQAAQQQQQIKSSDSPIKMVDIYEMAEEIKQAVINEIEGQIIKPDAESKVNMITLDQEQAYIDSVKQFDTFRGGAESDLIQFQHTRNSSERQQDDRDHYVRSANSEAMSEQWSEVSRRHEGQS